MQLLDKIKTRYGKHQLQNMLSARQQIVCTSYKQAQRIGILYNATKESDFKIIRKFVEVLKQYGKDVQSLGYVDLPELENFHIQPREYSFFCNKDLNWFKKPEEPSVVSFYNTEFDILIDLTLADYLPIKFILAQSKAKFKTGRYCAENIVFLDMLIDISEKPELEYLMEHIMIYLKMMN